MYPEGERGAIFGELESYKTVDEETPTSRGGKSTLHRDKIGKHDGRKRDNATVKNKGEDSESHIKIKEKDDLFPSHSCILCSNVEYHHRGHNEGCNVNETGS